MVLIALIAGFCVSGCNGNADTAGDNAKTQIVNSYQKGAFGVKLRVDSDAITIADQLVFEIEATADESVDIKLPEFEDAIGQFSIVQKSEPPPKFLDDNRLRYARTYRLKPFLSGDYQIPPVTVQFEAGDDQGPENGNIETEAMNIRVNSVLTGDGEKTFKTIMPPEPLPETIIPWVAAGIAGLVGMGLAGFIGFKWFRRRKNGSQFIVLRPAHEIAEEELNRLFSEKLVESGNFKAFYQRLSAILRRYIENRFGLRAPEQTTEEFLSTMRTAEDLSATHKQLLKNFLIHCDQVKFAELRPEPEDVREMSDLCRQFIAETRLQDDSESGGEAREARKHAV